jgi:predicted N-acetyltransferase YhbS
VTPRIRSASSSDDDAIRGVVSAAIAASPDHDDIQRRAWAAAHEAHGAAPWRADVVLVACTDDDMVVGVVSVRIDHRQSPGTAALEQLYVAPAHQHRGLGTALVDAAGQAATAQGATTMVVDASPAARGLLGSLGYEIVEHHAKRLGTVAFENAWCRRSLSGDEAPRRGTAPGEGTA